MDDNRKNRGNNDSEKNLSELMEFDFDDILMDDFSTEQKESSARRIDPKAKAEAEEAERKAEKKRKTARIKRGFKITFDIATWIKDLAIAALVLWVLSTFVATTIKMPNTSMNPDMKVDESFLISKIVYRFADPERGDVIAFNYSDSNAKQEAISRVIGLPGDIVNIDSDGAISINGVPLKTEYCNGKTNYIAGQMVYPYTVPEDHYFILSDNPSGTTDSRYRSIGAIAKADIIGRVVFCYWPKEAWRPIG